MDAIRRPRPGEAIFALHAGAGDVRLRSDMTVPALFGADDARAVGLALYGIELVDPDGITRALDLDDASMRDCFHPGERLEGLHYRVSAGDIVLPPTCRADLAVPLLLRVTYKASTLRGFIAPNAEPLRLVG